jgi:hypothetical protein
VKINFNSGDENGQRAVRVVGRQRFAIDSACVAASFPMHRDRGLPLGVDVIDRCYGCVQREAFASRLVLCSRHLWLTWMKAAPRIAVVFPAEVIGLGYNGMVPNGQSKAWRALYVQSMLSSNG